MRSPTSNKPAWSVELVSNSHLYRNRTARQTKARGYTRRELSLLLKESFRVHCCQQDCCVFTVANCAVGGPSTKRLNRRCKQLFSPTKHPSTLARICPNSRRNPLPEKMNLEKRNCVISSNESSALLTRRNSCYC